MASTEPFCLHELFEEQALESPESIAVLFGDYRISYDELNREANRLAHYLISLGVERETLVGVCVERSPKMLVGLLACLKAGACYVPIDPAYPADRIRYTVESSKMQVLLTEERHLSKLPSALRIVCLGRDANHWSNESPFNPKSGVASHNLAYVIYTSGSTGKPKGVMVEHHSVVLTPQALRREFSMAAGDLFPSHASQAFDISLG